VCSPADPATSALGSRRGLGDHEVLMTEEQADRLIQLVERMADRLDEIAQKLDTIASNTGD